MSADVFARLTTWSASVERRKGALSSLVRRKEKGEEEIKILEEAIANKQAALEICKAIEGEWQKTFEQDLAGVVSQGLTLVFEKPIRLEIESTFQRDASATTFWLHEDGMRLPILGAKGGGYVNVVSFLLRILLLLNTRPPLRKLLVLDEAFAEVSTEFAPNVATLLRQISDETGVQIILVTHEPAFGESADFVYEVKQSKKGVSSVELIERGAGNRHLYDAEEEE